VRLSVVHRQSKPFVAEMSLGAWCDRESQGNDTESAAISRRILTTWSIELLIESHIFVLKAGTVFMQQQVLNPQHEALMVPMPYFSRRKGLE